MEQDEREHHSKNRKNNRGFYRGDAVYGLGIIGALVYYFSTANSFWLFVFGFFKALFWPAFLVYQVLKYLHM